MTVQKTKSLQNIEDMMRDLSPESLRYHVLETAKAFKSSWIELGQYLYVVFKDKHYKEWGYTTFEVYCAKEIGIRHETAVKLLKSYYFLEKDEPQYLKREERKPSEVPSFEAVNALRLAKQNERLSPKDYGTIREEVLEKGTEPQEVKKKIKYLLKPVQAKEVSPEDKKQAAARKWVGQLENAMTELSNLSFPNKVLKQIEQLLDSLQGYKQ